MINVDYKKNYKISNTLKRTYLLVKYFLSSEIAKTF